MSMITSPFSCVSIRAGGVVALMFCLAAPVAAAPAAAPQGKTFGIGIVAGRPSGLSMKYMLASDQGLQFTIGAFGARKRNSAIGYVTFDSVVVSLDYLWTAAQLVQVAPFALNFYIGGGGAVGISYDRFAVVEARVPLGLSMAFRELPIEAFLEVAPALVVVPGLGFDINAGLGARWFF
jgi:hypothetical protein